MYGGRRNRSLKIDTYKDFCLYFLVTTMSRGSRIACFNDTKQRTALLPAPPASVKYNWRAGLLREGRPVAGSTTSVEVVDMDSIDCGLLWKTRGFNPLVLNLASDRHAGGGVVNGAGAQEESLFRRTNYWRTLTQDMYPLGRYEAVYSPGVRVIKTSEADGWRPMDATVDFIACPALRNPDVVGGRLQDRDVLLLKKKIELILQVAVATGHDCVIFGAMGCGAWNNPPEHVAQIFKEVLGAYNGVLRAAIFAVLNLSRGSYGSYADLSASNFGVFSRVLASSGA